MLACCVANSGSSICICFLIGNKKQVLFTTQNRMEAFFFGKAKFESKATVENFNEASREDKLKMVKPI